MCDLRIRLDFYEFEGLGWEAKEEVGVGSDVRVNVAHCA
jgi:hypothetical protein